MNGPPTWYNAFLNTGQETNMHPRKNSQCMPVFVVDGVLLMAIMASSNVDHICYMSSSMQITLKTNWTRGKLLGSSTLLIPGSTLWKLWWNLRSLSCWGWSFFFQVYPGPYSMIFSLMIQMFFVFLCGRSSSEFPTKELCGISLTCGGGAGEVFLFEGGDFSTGKRRS